MQHLSVLVLRLLFEQALGVLHNGGRMGFVGVPHYKNRALGSTFMQNISVAGGAASATTYDKQFLLKAVLDGDINSRSCLYFKL